MIRQLYIDAPEGALDSDGDEVICASDSDCTSDSEYSEWGGADEPDAKRPRIWVKFFTNFFYHLYFSDIFRWPIVGF